MSDTILSEAALRASLHDIRLPAEAAGGVLAELFAAGGLGGLLALCLLLVLRGLSRRGMRSRQASLPEEVARLAHVPPERRRVGLLHLMRVHTPERLEALRPDLYRAESALDADRIEAELLRDA